MKIGFIGLGNMGRSMALNLLKAGNQLVVYDIRREAGDMHVDAGAAWAESPREVAEASDVVLTSLPGPPEVEATALGDGGLLSSMKPGSVWFDLSTNSPAVVRRLHAQFAERGIDFLDAPVSGGVRGASEASLAVWVGGDRAVYERHEALLKTVGSQASYVGPIGAGTVAKLVHNCTTFMVQTAVIEAFTMGVKAGVEPLALWEAVCHGSNGRRRIFDFVPGFLQASHENVSFALKLGHKDVTLATELGKAVGVPMRMANLACEELTEAMARGWGNQNSSVSALLQQERAGLSFDFPPEEIQQVRERL